MTDIFYDTEFLDDGKTIELISIGLCCGADEYYAVNADCDFERIKENDWLVRNVVQRLPVTKTDALIGYIDHQRNLFPKPSIKYVQIDKTSSAVKPKWVIANEVRDFILQYNKPKLWAYYGAYDHVALAQLWGPMISLPEGIPMFTHELMQLATPLDLERAKKWSHPDAHNALADAKWNASLFDLAEGSRK